MELLAEGDMVVRRVGGPQKAEYCCSSECYGSGSHIFRAQRNFKYNLVQCLGYAGVDPHDGAPHPCS